MAKHPRRSATALYVDPGKKRVMPIEAMRMRRIDLLS